MLISLYKHIIQENNYLEDQSQLKLVELLSQYSQILERQDDWFIKKLFNSKAQGKKGVYVYGDVGRGKSFITNLFFKNLKVKNKHKEHFHKFIIDCHKNLNGKSPDADKLRIFANGLRAKYKVLYLDEFYINNIVDATIFTRLLPLLIELGIYVFITSNCNPEELYQDGLKREYIFPLIEFIENNLDIYHLDNDDDYRKRNIFEKSLYIYPYAEQNNILKMSSIVNGLTEGNKFQAKELSITENRSVSLSNTYSSIVLFEFDELCNRNLGAADYIAICENFSIVIIEKIPQMTQENHNEALRFITLIDCMYDNNIHGVFSAEVSLDNLYLGNTHKSEFKRAVSRIYEMQFREVDL
ncbi:MAG: cell division protein ZapE [Candidatus Midichloriaceae bacterium]|jgi:cell division protein ZapE